NSCGMSQLESVTIASLRSMLYSLSCFITAVFRPFVPCQLAVAFQVGKIPLPQRFVYADSHRVGKVQAPLTLSHRYTHAAFGVGCQQLFGQAGVLPPEDKVRAVRVNRIGVAGRPVRGGEEKRAAGGRPRSETHHTVCA